MSIRAQRRKCWEALPPITIETGFDLLTVDGRDRAFKELKHLRPDLIVAEWMCDPWSNIQNLNIAKGGMAEKHVYQKRAVHKHWLTWMAEVELWQRERGAHWIGENHQSA